MKRRFALFGSFVGAIALGLWFALGAQAQTTPGTRTWSHYIPAKYGRLVQVSADGSKMYFEDREGTIHVVTIDNDGAALLHSWERE